MRDRNNRGVPVKENYTGKTVAANLFRGIEAVGGKLVFEENGMIVVTKEGQQYKFGVL